MIEGKLDKMRERAAKAIALKNGSQVDPQYYNKIYGYLSEFFKLGYDCLFNTRYYRKTINEVKADSTFDLKVKKQILDLFKHDENLRPLIGLFYQYLKQEMNNRVQIDILMRIEGLNQFNEYVTPSGDIIEDYIDGIMDVKAPYFADRQDGQAQEFDIKLLNYQEN